MVEEIDDIEQFEHRLLGAEPWLNNELTNIDYAKIISFLQELKNIKLDYLDKRHKKNEKVILARYDVLTIDALVSTCAREIGKKETLKGVNTENGL